VRSAPHIQHRLPNGWADRDSNSHKQSLGLCDEDRVVGDRVSIDARAVRANVRTTPHIQHRQPNSWTDRNTKLVQTLIGTMSRSYGDRRARITGIEQGGTSIASAKRERVARARSAKQYKIVYSQTGTGSRTSDPAQLNLYPNPPTDTGSSIYIYDYIIYDYYI
jgi:hypothetical protein